MSAASDDFRLRYAPLMKRLADALERNEETTFLRVFDEAAQLREGHMLSELGEVTHDIECALARFCAETRINDLAEKDVPDARARLEHVLKMTDEAAHHTMDLVEAACAPAERISRQLTQLTALWQGLHAADASAPDGQEVLTQALAAFWEPARADAEQVQRNLREVILAQGYQDLSGQIIRSVMKLIIELEGALVSLVHLARGASPDCPATVAGARTVAGNTQGYGPVVPRVNDTNVVGGQDDIDALLSNLNI